LLAYHWPGNVRELEHLITRSALKALGRYAQRPDMLTLMAADFDLEHFHTLGPALISATTAPCEQNQPVSPGSTGLREAVSVYERQVISASLTRHAGNIASAARELGLDRANLNRLARRLGLK